MTAWYRSRLLCSALLLFAPLLYSSSGGSAFIMYDNTDSFDGIAKTNLAALLTAAGYSTVDTGSTLPGSLAGYQQVWDVRYNTAMSGTEISAYVAYLNGGGSLFVMGENTSFPTRDNSIVSLFSAAGGTVSLASAGSLNLQTVKAPFTGPNSIATITYQAAGGFANTGQGAAITIDANHAAGAVVFSPGTLTNAPTGTLISVLDVNFLEGPQPNSGETPFAKNLIAFLAAPIAIPAPVVISANNVPALSTWAIIALAGCLMGAGYYRLRAMQRS